MITDTPLSTKFRVLACRIDSFINYPKSSEIDIRDMAAAGFFYTRKADEVECFWCGGKLDGWDKGDEPLNEHAK